MAYFSKEIKNSLESLDLNVELATSPQPPLTSRFTPGNVMIFWYPVGGKGIPIARLGLVVGSQKRRSVFTNRNTKNILISFVELQASTSFIQRFVIKRLYKNRRASINSSVIRGLKAITGASNYKTYKLNSMRKIYSVDLNPEDIPEETE